MTRSAFETIISQESAERISALLERCRDPGLDRVAIMIPRSRWDEPGFPESIGLSPGTGLTPGDTICCEGHRAVWEVAPFGDLVRVESVLVPNWEPRVIIGGSS